MPEWPASSSGVLHSTVLAEAAFLQKQGFDCLFIGSDLSSGAASTAQERISKSYAIDARVAAHRSRTLGALALISMAAKVARICEPVVEQFTPTHIWIRSTATYGPARRMARRHAATLVFSVRGAVSEEIALRRGRGFHYWAYRPFETLALKRAHRLTGVSHRLKDWIRDRVGRSDTVVVPCCFDSERFRYDPGARRRIREEIGLDEHQRVLCYSGGLSKWQRAPEIAALCAAISKVRDSYHFIFLSQQADHMRELLDRHGLSRERCVVRSCLPDEVPGYLSAADAGLVLRHDIVVNNVASPIKIGEYLGCGLPVILTKGIGDYSEMLPQAGVGLVLDETGDTAGQVIDYLEQPGFEQLRNRASAFARENLSWEAHLDTLRHLFRLGDP